MIQDQFLSAYDFSEKHQISIKQSPERIYSLVYDLDFSESWIIRTLFKLRGMGTRTTQKQGLLEENFIQLSVRENDEMVLGLVGQFWKANGNLHNLQPNQFVAFDQPGFLKATWNFKLVPQSATVTTLQTETRVFCTDRNARRKFSIYWFFIKPFSGLIRMEMLRSIKKKAESLPS